MQGRLTAYPRVVISTHTFFYGASEALRDYLIKKKIPSLVYIGHPLLGEKRVYTLEKYATGRRTAARSLHVAAAGTPFALVRDAFRTVKVVTGLSPKRTLYIGTNPLNACVGVILRIIRAVDYVVFYAIDFTPERSKSALINGIYHMLERIAVRYSDQCWNVSPRIAEGRKEFLGIAPDKKRDHVVPIGVWGKDIVSRARRTSAHTVVFVGHLLKKQGVQVVLRAFPHVLQHVPDAKFVIVGGGEYEQRLRSLTESLSLGKSVSFLGWQQDQRLVRKHIRYADIAVSLYEPSGAKTTNFSYYADPTKIKTYLSCGIPVIMTSVPHNADDLRKSGAARVVPYQESEVARVIISLLSNPEELFRMKQRSVTEARKYRWESIFDEAFRNL